jgi:hypothetical protein
MPVHVERGSSAVPHTPHVPPFWRHFFEMFAIMVGGMLVFAAVFVTIIGVKSWEATTEYASASLLVIAAGMSFPMVVWMLRQGMGWRNSAEMAGVRVLPVVAFLCLVWFGITDSALCGPLLHARDRRNDRPNALPAQ